LNYLPIKKHITYLTLLFIFLFKTGNATHIVGGEIYYDNLGGGNYKINMKVYRDCINGVPPFDGFPNGSGSIIPAYFTIFDVSGNVILSSQFTAVSQSNVAPTNNSPCAPAVNGIACVEEAIYESFVNLPSKLGGYYIVYQRCCRNNTILNLISPGGVGASYWTHIPGPEVVAVNSSPRFTLRPSIYICANVPIGFNHIATDADGDSLVYSLCTPFDGLDACCPTLNSGAPSGSSFCVSPPSVCPTVNSAPPYISVPFAAPYSASYPMASSPAININPQTGFLNGVPTILGQWVVGVCVEEYRGGVLIGTHHRDFQFNVIDCPFVVVPQITHQTTTNNGAGTGYCNGLTVTLGNQSSASATTFFWDFGDLTTTTDTSSLKFPTYTYTVPGTYTVQLIANPGSSCSDTTTETFEIHPLLKPDFLTPASQCFLGNNFNYVALGSYQGNGSFTWNFGNSAIPLTANTVTVNNVTYSTTGIKTVSLTVSENGCLATTTKTLEVAQNPIATIGNFVQSGCNPVTFTVQNQSTTGPYISYLWTFSNGTTSNSISPTVTFTNAGVYGFTLSAMSNQVCIDTTNLATVSSVSVFPSPTAAFNITPKNIQCYDGHFFNFNNTSTALSALPSYTWNFGANANPQTATTKNINNVTFSNSGIYTVTLTTYDNGCPNSTTQVVEIYNNPLAKLNFTTSEGCNPLTVNFESISTGVEPLTFLWSFSDGTTSTIPNPTRVFSPEGIYTLSLTVSSTSLCVASNSIVSVKSITVNPTPISSFTATPIETSISDPDISFTNLSLSPYQAFWYYDFNDGGNSVEENPNHTYLTWGNYNVTQTLTNTFGCSHKSNLLIKILPEFRFWIANAFTPFNGDG
jgi:PKD repeat protein